MDLPAELETDHFHAWFNWSTEHCAVYQPPGQSDLTDYLNGKVYPGGRIELALFSAAIVRTI